MIITCITSTAANGTTRTGYYTGTKAAAMEAAEAKYPGSEHRLICRYEGTEIPETETDQEPEELTTMIIITGKPLVPASIKSRQAGSVRPSGRGRTQKESARSVAALRTRTTTNQIKNSWRYKYHGTE